MKKTFLSFLILIFVGCNGNDPANKTVDKNLGNGFVVKYPLPKTPDSLLDLLTKVPDDTNKVNVLNALGKQLMYGSPDTSIILGKQAMAIAEKLVWEKGKANSMGQLGVYYYLKDEYSLALDFYQKALKIDEKINNKKGIGQRLSNIGNVYWNQGDFPKALDYYLKALKLDEEQKNKNGIAADLGNIGIVYYGQADYPKALDYYFRALKLDEELGNKSRTSSWLGSIGGIYNDEAILSRERLDTAQASRDYNKALDYFFKALKIDEELGNKNGIARHLSNIGNSFDLQGDYPNASALIRNQLYGQALIYYMKSLKVNEEIGRKNGIAINLGNIGIIYCKTGKYKEAFPYLYRALALDDSIGVRDGVKDDYAQLSNLYEKSNSPLPDSTGGTLLNMEEMRLRSLHYFKSYINLRDTLFSEENKKQLVRKEMNFVFEKKEATTKAENDKKEALGNEQLKQKEKERNYFIAGFGLVLLLAGFIFRSYRQKQKANEIISRQKNLVEEKQKAILDSIHYAKRIQQSLLPTEKYIGRNLKRLKNY